MKLNELKKAEPATTKSSGTDDPSKYVGGWEAYDEPQGINDRQDRKVLTKEDVQQINGKNVIWSNDEYYMTVDNPQDADRIEVFTNTDDERVGWVAGRDMPEYPKWKAITFASVNPWGDHRGKRLGVLMYQGMIQYLHSSYKGLLGYLPDTNQYSKKIYSYLNAQSVEGDDDILIVPRRSFFESNSYGPSGTTRFAPDPDEFEYFVSAADKKEIKASSKPPKRQIKMNVKAMTARGHKPKLNPYQLDETVRQVINGTLNAEYEIVDDEDKSIGYAVVQEGVIETLDYDTAARQHYRGHIMSALLAEIVTEADANKANLAIRVTTMDGEVKNILERFGFRRSGGMVLKRTYGSIRPTSVSPPQGMVNR